MRRISVAERRARLGVRHRLASAARADDPADVARSLVAVHGTDPSSVYLGLLTRMGGGRRLAVERALYADRTLIRLLGMRRTVFVASLDVAPLIQAACSTAVAAAVRRQLLRWLSAADACDGTDPSEWLAGTEQAALLALAALGEATATELAGADPRLALQLSLAPGTSFGGQFSIASRVLALLAADGEVVRARPRGSWTSHQYRWAPMAAWYPPGLTGVAAATAEAELARRWLHAYGPATADDLRWWAGWTKTQLRRALTAVRPDEVDLDGVPGIVLPGDTEPVPEPDPWLALLPALDSTPMGWQQRDWFLGEHGPRLFDRTGNVGPSLWWNGRIVGGWAQDRDGDVVCRFTEDAGAEAVAAAAAAALSLTAILDGTRLTPRTRGRTWLEEELAGGVPGLHSAGPSEPR